MGSGAEEPTDDDFNLVTGLYHFDGTNGGDNNTFSDTSGNSHSITRNGNTTQGTFTPFSADDGKWSNHFELGDALMTTSSGSSIVHDQSTFTCEAWILTTGAPVSGTNIPGLVMLDGAANFGAAALNLLFGPLADYKLGIAWYAYGWQSCRTTSATITAGVWTHVAVSVSSNTIKLFINGTEITSLSGTTTLSNRTSGTSGYLAIGGTHYASSYSYQGFVSNCRIVDGTALYSGDFTPSTSPLTAVSGTDVLACTSRNFDGVNAAGSSVAMDLRNTPKVLPFAPFAPSASYVKTTNGGSGYFDGTGDYLSITNESDLTPDTGDFTIECWVYFNTVEYTGIWQLDTTPLSANGYIGPVLEVTPSAGSGPFVWSTMTKHGGDSRKYSSVTPSAHAWHHTAVVRTSGTIKVFVNGTQVISDFTDSTDFSDRDSLVIGGFYSTTYLLDGYISGFRYVKGTAVYTSAFTPPTAPPTAVTNTELLLNFTNASAFDNSGKTLAETTGADVDLSTSIKKFGTASLDLSGGTTNRLGFPPSPLFRLLDVGNFTVEFFLYVEAYHASYSDIVGVFNGSTAGWLLYQSGANLDVYTNGSQKISGSRPSTDAWHHIALTRDGTSLKLFVDGTQLGSTSTASLGADQTAYGLVFGGDATGRNGIEGHIDEFRLTLGKARYTSNFTAPTEAFPNK